MKELRFFDACCKIGGTMMDSGHDIACLLKEMDRAGVERALVVHASVDTAPHVANQQIAKDIKVAPDRLVGVWCMLPQQCPEIPGEDVIFEMMHEQGIGALTLNPYEHLYVPCRMTLGRMMDAAAERKVPIILDCFDQHWKDLYDFVAEFPKNVFIFRASWGKWGYDRQLRPLLENYVGFHFALNGYWVPEGIRDLAELYGADRLLFASGFPVYNLGNQMLQLKYSGLPTEDIVKIAGGNMERLMREAGLDG